MISSKRPSEAEIEEPPTLEDPLLPKITHQSCENLGSRPYGVAFRSSKGFITFVVCMAVFTDAFLYTMIIPILPDTLTKNAGVAPEDVQYWTSILLSAFGAANLFVSPFAGFMADRTATRRMPLLLGLYALLGSTILYCFGRTPMILVVARGLQGASASVIWVVGLALLSDTMGASSSGVAMGWMGVGRFTGSLLGPSLSGIFYDLWGHYAVFAMAFAVLFFDIVLRFAMIERKVAEKWISFFDTLSYGAIAIESVEREIGEEEVYSDQPTRRDDTYKSGSICSTETSFTDVVGSHAMGIVPLLTSCRILAALWTYFICSLMVTALESVLSIYTMNLFNWTAAQSGLVFIMLSFSILTDPWIGHLTDVHGCRGITVIGLILGAAVWVALCFITTNTIAAQIILSVLLFILGFSTALMVTPNMVEISRAVDAISQAALGGKVDPAKVMGRAYSLLNMSWGLGSIVGPLWGGGIIWKWGWVPLCGTFVVLQAVAAWIAFLFAGERNGEKGEAE